MRKTLACCLVALCCQATLAPITAAAVESATGWHGPAIAEKAIAEKAAVLIHDGPAVAERAVRPPVASESFAPAIAEKPIPQFDGPAIAERATHELVPQPVEIAVIAAESIEPVKAVGPAIAEKPAREHWTGPAIAEKAPRSDAIAQAVAVADAGDSPEHREGHLEGQDGTRIARIAVALAPHVAPRMWFAAQWLITR
jgi:hypothetical protein